MLSAAAEALEVNVTNDGPAILDSTITFRAQLIGADYPELYYVFQHNVPSGGGPVTVTNSTEATLRIAFLAYRHQPGEYGSCKFLLTRDIVGRIVVSQDNHTLQDDQTIVSTNRTTNFTFELHDPSGFFTNSSDSLSWKLDYGLSHYAPYYTINFTDTNVHTVNLIVVALVTRPSSTSPQVKLGSFTRTIAPQRWVPDTNPITGVNVQGNIWLRRGDVVSLQVSCNGSAPYNYCWKYLPSNATSNSTANLTCDEPISTNQCQFPLVHYFPQDGSHFIAILVSNIVQAKPYIKNIEVHIYDVPRSGLLSTIILPIVCSLLAFVILGHGHSVPHPHAQPASKFEVADFDFQRPDLELTEKTFWEHLLGAWRDAFPNWSKQSHHDVDSAGEGDSLTAPENNPSPQRRGKEVARNPSAKRSWRWNGCRTCREEWCGFFCLENGPSREITSVLCCGR
ncbi:hypothetical protein MRX96_021841 [Rhipicephalus microplus]